MRLLVGRVLNPAIRHLFNYSALPFRLQPRPASADRVAPLPRIRVAVDVESIPCLQQLMGSPESVGVARDAVRVASLIGK